LKQVIVCHSSITLPPGYKESKSQVRFCHIARIQSLASKHKTSHTVYSGSLMESQPLSDFWMLQ
jgi:hypothetical protein